MRVSLFTALLAGALLLAPLARATQVPVGELPVPSAVGVTPEPAPRDVLPDGDGEEDDDDDLEAGDAPGIQEDLNAGKTELEELLKAESKAIPDIDTLPRHFGRLGAGNPLRSRISDADLRGGETFEVPAIAPQGDAGGVLAELGGLDLAALKAEYDIPVELNGIVLEYIRFFQGPGRKWYTHWLERSKRWVPLMRPILAEEGVPLDLVYLAMIESGFSPYAYSWAHASGFWQFMSPTGKRFSLRDDFWVDERRDPVMSTRAAARYLKMLHDEFGSWYIAWASYNAGEGKLRKAMRQSGTRDFWAISDSGNYLRKETQHYVPKLIAAAIIAKHPERFGFTNIQAEGPFLYDEVEITDSVQLSEVAKAAGISLDELQLMNPSLRRWCTPPTRGGVGYTIKIPAGKRADFLAAFAKIQPLIELTFRHHRVARGETPSGLARRFGTTPESILRLNGLASARDMRPGTDLVMPVSLQIAQNVPDSGASWSEPRPARWRHGRGRTSRYAARSGRRGGTVVASATVRTSPGKRYVVRSGDSLWSIAHKFGVAVNSLQHWNGFSRNPKLQVGHSILVGVPTRKAERANGGKKGRGRG
jgi:membrane-bound lytic murein transglycosylase D